MAVKLAKIHLKDGINVCGISNRILHAADFEAMEIDYGRRVITVERKGVRVSMAQEAVAFWEETGPDKLAITETTTHTGDKEQIEALGRVVVAEQLAKATKKKATRKVTKKKA